MSDMAEIEAYQGQPTNRVLQIANLDGTSRVGIYTSSSVLSATLWAGQNLPTAAIPTVAWYTAPDPVSGLATQTGYDQGQVAWSVSGAQTTALDPAGEYFTLVTQATGGASSVVWEGRVKVLAVSGSVTPAPPDLATYDFVEASMSELNLADSQRDFIPYLTSIASATIRRFCFGRNFDLRTYTEEYDVALDGSIRLLQVPVQQVLRVAASPQTAITVYNNSTSVQSGQVVFAYTGTYDGYTATAQVITGLTLNWFSNGTASTATINFSANETCNTLAAAINGVGSGWTAVADSVYGAWPCTQLIGGYTGQEAVTGQGAILQVYGSGVAVSQGALDQRTGSFYVGYTASDSANSPRWGPDWASFCDSGQSQWSRVLVTYTAGFATIPMPVQFACAELVKFQITRLKTDDLLDSETAADYSYKLNLSMMAAMPPSVRQALAPYRLHYA